MRVFISVDLEGITGTTDEQEMRTGRDSYERARRWMTADANAAIAGAFDGGAAEVMVCDSHGSARNLLVEELDGRARLVKGLLKPRRMVQGLDASHDVALLVGYHARAGAGPGVLNHTWIGKELVGLRINGEPAGEIALVAAYAGHLGVPVGLVTGDDVACREAQALLPGVETVEVKRAVDRFAAEVSLPAATLPAIREGAERAVRQAGDLEPHGVPGPLHLEVQWSSTSIAQICSMVPGVEVVDSGTTTRWQAADATRALDLLVVLTTLAVAVGQQPPYS